MDGVTLADRLSRGMGAAARVFGLPYDAFRPEGAVDPLRSELRFLRLPAAFDGGDPGYRRPGGYERGLRGTFDSAYLAVGDLLRGPRGVLFVAMLPPLARPLCVLTNAVVRASRPDGPGAIGLNPYGGVLADRQAPLLSGWPAHLLPGGGGRAGGMPGDGELGGFSLLLPLGAPALRGSDIVVAEYTVADQAGSEQRFVVGTVALSELGWRLSLRQVGA